MTEEQLEHERCVDDDYNVVNHYYRAKHWHPDIPFFLQDENGDTYEFGWSLIYQYIDRLNSQDEDTNYKYVIIVDWLF